MASQVKEEQQVPHPDLSNERCEEVLEIGETLNKLMNRIEKLKINVYEDKLNLKALEIQYLKSQALSDQLSLRNRINAIHGRRKAAHK